MRVTSVLPLCVFFAGAIVASRPQTDSFRSGTAIVGVRIPLAAAWRAAR